MTPAQLRARLEAHYERRLNVSDARLAVLIAEARSRPRPGPEEPPPPMRRSVKHPGEENRFTDAERAAIVAGRERAAFARGEYPSAAPIHITGADLSRLEEFGEPDLHVVAPEDGDPPGYSRSEPA